MTAASSRTRTDANDPPVRPAAPWLWRPSDAPWFARLADLSAGWRPSPEIGLDGDTIRRLVQQNADERAGWLFHPCLNAITLPRSEAKVQRDFQLAVWVAMHTAEPLGVATLDRPVWVWAPNGGSRLEPGVHDLNAVAEALRPADDDRPPAVDPWARSVKVSFHQLWRDLAPFGPDERADLKNQLGVLVRALAATELKLPDCWSWVRSRTRVVIPLRRLSGEHSSSSSASDLPGVVFLTLHNEIQAVEALVHESAHQHLFTAEAAGPLVDPRDTSLYSSPLRDDARPLRGILLACHALAYIAAFYTDALGASIAPAGPLEAQLDRVRPKLHDARATITAHREQLTVAGAEFVDRTLEVGAYSA